MSPFHSVCLCDTDPSVLQVAIHWRYHLDGPLIEKYLLQLLTEGYCYSRGFDPSLRNLCKVTAVPGHTVQLGRHFWWHWGSVQCHPGPVLVCQCVSWSAHPSTRRNPLCAVGAWGMSISPWAHVLAPDTFCRVSRRPRGANRTLTDFLRASRSGRDFALHSAVACPVFAGSLKPLLVYSWSCLAHRIGHSIPIWQSYAGSLIQPC
jgi:hypothetical protein